jgi:hypothetical protein
MPVPPVSTAVAYFRTLSASMLIGTSIPRCASRAAFAHSTGAAFGSGGY